MNGLFQSMCNEAVEELSNGKKGWREAETNTLLMACFGMLSEHLSTRISKPLWWFAGSVSAGVLGYIVKIIIS